MKQKIILFSIVFLIGVTACKKSKIDYPETKKVDQVDEYFGVKVEDPYRWLEDDNSDGEGNDKQK